MKLILFLGLTVFVTTLCENVKAVNNTSIVAKLPSSNARLLNILGRLKSIWAKFAPQQNDDSFIGRCFGVARKLKFAMPLIIFKLGVIVTVLAFLTIFSLKSLALLGFLVLLNVSGAMTKLAVLFTGKHAESKAWSPPQNVHLHVHQTKDGKFELGHTAPGWEDRLGTYGSSNEDVGSVENSGLYNSLYLKNLLKNSAYVNR